MYINHHSDADFEQKQIVKPLFGLFFHGTSNSAFYVTQHQVGSDGNIKTGKFVTPESVSTMVEDALNEHTLISQNTKLDFIPEHVLVDKPTRTVWYRHATVRKLLFKFGKKQHTINAALPSLLFIREQTNLRIFSLNSNQRPTPESKIFHAPLMNINELGSLCLGDAVLPRQVNANESTLIETEKCFFNCFSGHINHSRTLETDSSSVTTTQLFNYFVNQEKTQTNIFNTDDLSDTNKLLKEVL